MLLGDVSSRHYDLCGLQDVFTPCSAFALLLGISDSVSSEGQTHLSVAWQSLPWELRTSLSSSEDILYEFLPLRMRSIVTSSARKPIPCLRFNTAGSSCTTSPRSPCPSALFRTVPTYCTQVKQSQTWRHLKSPAPPLYCKPLAWDPTYFLLYETCRPPFRRCIIIGYPFPQADQYANK